MASVRSRSESNEPQPERLSLRWTVIIAVAAAASIPAVAVGGIPGAIGAFLLVAGALHAMVA